MNLVTLHRTLGDSRADRILAGVIGTFEICFPDRVRAYYVDGSHADGTPISTSDLDLTILFKDHFRGERERQRVARLAECCAALSAVELDIGADDEATLGAGITPMLKIGSWLAYGEEVRETLSLLPIEDWARERMNAAYWLMIQVFRRTAPIIAPLGYPDPADPFFGYANRPILLPDGTVAASTRNLIRVTGWIATARLALEARRYVARKRDCHLSYRQWINDEWSSLLEEIYRVCRGEWHALVPDAPEDRERLRAICARTLAFENDFLERYRRFVLMELRGDGDLSPSRAVWVLARLPFCDAEIIAAVSARSLTATPGRDTQITQAWERLRDACPQ